MLGGDADVHPLLPGLPRLVLGIPGVLLGELVDLLVGSLMAQLGGPRDRQPPEAVLRVEHGHGRTPVVAQVVGLGATLGGVEDDRVVVDVHPHDGVVRRAVLAERRDDAEVGIAEELLLLFAQLGHTVSLV